MRKLIVSEGLSLDGVFDVETMGQCAIAECRPGGTATIS
jgi:hypothetical protein